MKDADYYDLLARINELTEIVEDIEAKVTKIIYTFQPQLSFDERCERIKDFLRSRLK